jgi:cytochrome P450 family 144
MTLAFRAGDRLLGAQIVDDPYPFYAQLRREAPVWRVPGTDAFFVSTWDLVVEATGRVEEFSNNFRHSLYSEDDGAVGLLTLDEGGAPDVFAGADPPAHTVHRKLFFPGLVQKRMNALEGDVSTLADGLLDEFVDANQADAALGLANPLPIRVMAERVIGFRDPDVAQLQQWVFAGSRFLGGRLRLDEMASVGGDVAGMLPWVADRLDQALASPSEGNVLDAAAVGVREGVLTREEASFTLMVLLGAGGETTTSLIGNAIRILAERSDLQDELRANLAVVPAFVEEVLRLESPFRFHPRTARGAVELGGVEIPDGALVALLWASANRDESVFERPDEVVVDRSNAHLHLAFGRGIHHCVGAPLARLESRVVLTKLLERTVRFTLDPARPPRGVDSLWVRRHERLPIVVDRA